MPKKQKSAGQKGKPNLGSPFLKTVEAVAIALGLKLYDQRKQRDKQLEAVRMVTGREDFPQRAKGLWPRASVVEWGGANLALGKGKREFKIVESLKGDLLNREGGEAGAHGVSRPTSGELPVQNDGPQVADLFPESAPNFEKSLDLWQDKLVNPDRWPLDPILSWQITKLERYRPHLFQSAPAAEGQMAGDAITNIEGGYRGVANWIRQAYHGKISRVPTHTDIQNWNKGDYLPVGCREPFPSSDANNGRYKTSAVREWVEKYLLKSEAAQDLALPLDYRQAQEKLDYERSAAEYEVWQQSNSDKYILKDLANRTGTAIGIAARNSVREALEKNMINRVTPWLAEFIKDDAGRFNFIENLRSQCIGAFTEWQGQFAGQLEGLMKRNLETGKVES